MGANPRKRGSPLQTSYEVPIEFYRGSGLRSERTELDSVYYRPLPLRPVALFERISYVTSLETTGVPGCYNMKRYPMYTLWRSLWVWG